MIAAGMAVLALAGCNLGHVAQTDVASSIGLWDRPYDPAECRGLRYADFFREDGSALRRDTAHALVSGPCMAMHDHLSLGVIEFDDSGSHWDDVQLRQVLGEIERIVELQVGGTLPSDGIVVVAFVHGWRHNASEGSRSLLEFRQLVRQLASKLCAGDELSADETCAKRPHVFGVYLGWRGDPLALTNRRTRNVPFESLIKAPQVLTFWNRKAAAQRVAASVMTSTILRILEAVERADDTLTDGSGTPAKKANSVVIGHSLGGLIVERAVSQAFLAKWLDSTKVLDEVASGDEGMAALRRANRRWQSEIVQLRRKKRQSEVDQSEIVERARAARAAAEDLRSELARAEKQRLEGQAAAERFLARPTMPFRPLPRMCGEFSIERVRACAQDDDPARSDAAEQMPVPPDSLDLRPHGRCVRQELECLYRTASCAARALAAHAGRESAVPTETDQPDVAGPGAAEPLAECVKLVGVEPPEDVDPGDSGEWTDLAGRIEDAHEGISLLSPSGQEDPGRDGFTNLPPSCGALAGDADTSFDAALARYLGEREFWARWEPWDDRPWWHDLRVPDPVEQLDESLAAHARLAETEVEAMLVASGAAAEEVCASFRDTREAEAQRRKIETLGANADDFDSHAAALGELARTAEERLRKAAAAIHENELTIKATLRSLAKRLDRYFRPPADLVLLVNPASEAIAAQQLINSLCHLRADDVIWDLLGDIATANRPWILSITSQGDLSTRVLFPSAMHVQRTLSFDTAARNPTADPGRDEEGAQGCNVWFDSYVKLVTQTAGHTMSLHSHVIPQPEAAPGAAAAFEFETSDRGAFRIIRREDARNQSPYWIMSAPKAIIGGHNDVFGPFLLDGIAHLVAESGALKVRCPVFDETTKRCVQVE